MEVNVDAEHMNAILKSGEGTILHGDGFVEVRKGDALFRYTGELEKVLI